MGENEDQYLIVNTMNKYKNKEKKEKKENHHHNKRNEKKQKNIKRDPFNV